MNCSCGHDRDSHIHPMGDRPAWPEKGAWATIGHCSKCGCTNYRPPFSDRAATTKEAE